MQRIVCLPHPLQWLVPEEEIGHPSALVLMVFPPRRPRAHGLSGTHVGEQLDGPLVQADLGTPGIIGPSIDIEHVLHVPDGGCALPGWDAPLLLQMRLKVVFLSVRRTNSSETTGPL